MDEEKWIGWNDAKRERIRVKIKKIKENMKGGGGGERYVDDVSIYR